MRALATAVSVTALLVGAPAAVAAGPAKPGAVYEGTSAGRAGPVFVKVSEDGARISDFDVTARARCTNGKRATFGVYAVREKRPRIGSDGSATFASRPSKLALRNLGNATGTARTTWTGRFSADGRRFAGSISVRWRNRRTTCSASNVAFTAIDASRGAGPYRGRSRATGLYRAGRRRGLKSLSALVYARANYMRSLRISVRSSCTNGQALPKTNVIEYQGLKVDRPTSRFHARYRYRIAGYGYVDQRFRLAIRFVRRDGRYLMRGVYRGRSVVYKHRKRLTTCSIRTPFSGRLARPGA